MIRYQVVLECDYCHDREIIDLDDPTGSFSLPDGWQKHEFREEGMRDFCCEGHMTAYLDAKEKRE